MAGCLSQRDPLKCCGFGACGFLPDLKNFRISEGILNTLSQRHFFYKSCNDKKDAFANVFFFLTFDVENFLP